MLSAEVVRASQELLPCCRSAGVVTTKAHTCWQASAQRDAKATVLISVSSVRGVSSLGAPQVRSPRNQEIPVQTSLSKQMETSFEKRLESQSFMRRILDLARRRSFDEYLNEREFTSYSYG